MREPRTIDVVVRNATPELPAGSIIELTNVLEYYMGRVLMSTFIAKRFQNHFRVLLARVFFTV